MKHLMLVLSLIVWTLLGAAFWVGGVWRRVLCSLGLHSWRTHGYQDYDVVRTVRDCRYCGKVAPGWIKVNLSYWLAFALFALKGCAHFWVVLLFCGIAGADIQFNRFKNAIREEIVKTKDISVEYDDIKKEYKTKDGIYYAKVKKNMKDSFPIGFEFDGKSFFMEPLHAQWDIESASRLFNREVFNDDISLVINAVDASEPTKKEKKVKFAGKSIIGLDLSVFLEDTRWREIVEIDSSLLTIPEGAQYLEIVFQIQTDMNLPSGNVSNRFELSEDCWLEPAKAGIAGTTDFVIIEQSFLGDIYTKRIPVSQLTGVVWTDIEVTFGSEATLYTNNTMYTFCSVDDSTLFCMYKTSSNHGTARIATVSNGEITIGDAYEFLSSNMAASSENYMDCICYDTNKVMLVFYHNPSSYYLSGIIATISGTEISYGTRNDLHSSSYGYTDLTITGLSTSSTYVFFYDSYQGYARSIVCTISGTTITGNSPDGFGADSGYVDCYDFDTTHVIISCRISNQAKLRIGTIAAGRTSYGDTTNLYGTETISELFDMGSFGGGDYISVFVPSDGKGYALVANVSGSTISCASPYKFCDGYSYETRVSVVDGNTFIVYYKNETYAKSRIGTRSGTAITYGEVMILNEVNTSNLKLEVLDPYTIVYGYCDLGGDYYTHLIIGMLPFPVSQLWSQQQRAWWKSNN